jgi:hypothetical protein
MLYPIRLMFLQLYINKDERTTMKIWGKDRGTKNAFITAQEFTSEVEQLDFRKFTRFNMVKFPERYARTVILANCDMVQKVKQSYFPKMLSKRLYHLRRDLILSIIINCTTYHPVVIINSLSVKGGEKKRLHQYFKQRDKTK